MRQKLFNSTILVILLFSITSAWALEKPNVYDVASGSRPAVAVNNNEGVYVVYESPVTYNGAKAVRDRNGHVHSLEGSAWTLPGIWFVQSGAGSEDKWTFPLTIPVFNASRQPAIAVEKNGAIDLVMTTTSESGTALTDIIFTQSTDSGRTWCKAIDIARTPGQSSEPAIAIAPDSSIHVVWSDTSRGENLKDIFYSYSKDGGKTWGKNQLLPADNVSKTPGESSQPTIAISKDGTIHVSWLDTAPGETRPDIYYSYKTDGEWTQPINVNKSTHISSHPAIACGAKNKVYISWSDNSGKGGGGDIWYAIANKYGHFDKPINMSSTPGVSSEPVIAADESGYVAIAWSDTSSKPSKPDIYCRISNNGGSSFSNVIDLSHSQAVNKHPKVVIGAKKMLVTWEESDGASKKIKIASMELKNIATGTVLNGAPTSNLHNSQ